MKKVLLQHGDVVFFKGDKIPSEAKKIKAKKGFIIEKGEGVHTHVLLDEVDVYEKDGVMWFKSDAPFRIDHEEHGVKTLPAGVMWKEIEREFDYEEMEARRTAD